MARYIDADILIKQDFQDYSKSDVEYAIDHCPTADVQEVKRGQWIEDGNGVQVCSECGEEHEWQDFRAPYCDMCGAKMDEGKER